MQQSQLRRLFDGAPPAPTSPSTTSSITSIPVVVVGHEEPPSGLEALKNKHVRDKGTRLHRDSVDDLALLSLLTSASTSSSDTCGGAPSAAEAAAGVGLGKENRRSSSVRTQRVSSAVHRDTTPHKRKSRGSAIRSPSVAPRQPLTPSTHHHHQHKPQPTGGGEAAAAYEACDVERPTKVKAKQQQPHTPPVAGERRVRRRPKKSPAVSNEDLRREIAGTLRSHLGGGDVSPAAAAATPKRKASSLAGVERNRLGYAHPPSSSSSSTSSSSRGAGPLSASSGCVRLRSQRSLDGLLGQPLRLRAPCGPVEGEHGRLHHLRLQLHVPRLDVERADHDNDDDGEWEACDEQPAKLNGRATFIETAAKGREAGLRFIALHPRSGLPQSDAAQQQQQAEAPHVAVGAGRRRRSRSLTDVRKALREGSDSASSTYLAPHGTDGKERARRKKAGRRRSSLMKVFDSLRNKLAGPEDSEEDGETSQRPPHEERTDASSGKHSHKQQRQQQQQPSALSEETAGGLRLACPTSFNQLLAQGGTLPGVVAGSVFANWDAHQNRLEDPGLVGSLVLAVRHWGFTPEHLFTAFLEAYYFPPLLSAPASRSLYTPAAPALLPFRRKLASFLVEWVDVAYEADFSGRALGQKLKVLVNEVMVRHGLKDEANAVRNRIWASSIRHPRSLTAALRLRSPSTAGAPSSPGYHPAAATVQPTATTAVAAPGAERLARAVKGGKAEVATPSQSSRQLRPQASVLVRTAPATPSSSTSQQTQARMGRVASERMIERIPTSGKVKPMNVLQVRSRVIAQQLTRIDYELLGKVDLREFTDMAFTKPELSPNINLLIEQCNKISYWVCSQVLILKKFSHQVKALRKFINIAYKCLKMGNFASLMALSLGLNLSPLTRLEELWEEAYRDGKCAAKMRKVNTFLPLVGNCKEYREVLARHMERLARLDEATRSGVDAPVAAPPASPRQQQQREEHEQPAEEAEGEEQQVRYPLIPFLAVYMKDLTFINDGNSHLMRGGHLNVDKMLRWGRILREIQLLQRQPCPIEVDELVHNLLININFISEETLWNISSSLKLQHSRD